MGASWFNCGACGKIFSDYREVFYCDVYWGGAKLQKYDHDRMSCSQCGEHREKLLPSY